MKNIILSILFIVATLCCGFDIKAQSVGDEFTIDHGDYLLLYTVKTLNPNTVSVECDLDWYDNEAMDDIDGLTIPETVTDRDGNVYTVTAVAQYAFEAMDLFTGKLELPSTITSIGSHAFEGTQFNGDLIIPENVKTLGSSAFSGCKIKSLVLPPNLTKIGSSCFYNCNRITSIELGDKITNIGSQAFYGCRNIKSLELPKRLKVIGDEAFCKTGIKEIILSSNIEEIGENSFSTYRNSLVKVKCNLTYVPELYGYPFGEEFNENLKIYVPATAYDDYISADYWYYYEDHIVALPTFIEDGSINDASNWMPSGVPASSVEVFIDAEATIGSTETFSTNTFGLCENGSIIIEDGGQLIHNGSNDDVTILKSISSYVLKEDGYLESGWYTISSPFSQIGFNSFSKNGYELFRYDEPTYTWENIKNTDNVFDWMENGRGYIYANDTDIELELTGNINCENVTCNLTASGELLTGFNLIGNPFMHDIYKGSGAAFYDANLSTGFYTLSNEGAWSPRLDSESIRPVQGILVQTASELSLEISKTATRTRSSNKFVKISVTNGKFEDATYAEFNNGIGLNKIEHRNMSIPMIYIPANNENYAIAVMDRYVEEIPVSFEAKTMGEYTISISTNMSDYEKIVLVDLKENKTIDIMHEDYKFFAMTDENPERFIIKMSRKNKDTIIYHSDDNVIVNNINGNGIVMIYDMTGRVVTNYNTNGTDCQIYVGSLTNGTYIVHLTDENGSKTQKIILNH